MEKQDKKYYLVSLGDGSKSPIKDGVDEHINFNKIMDVYAEELNGNLIEILTGKKILDAEKNYNSNILDARKFLEENYSLFGISKVLKSSHEIHHHLSFITRQETTEKTEQIAELSKKTLEEIKKQYELLKEAEKNFSSEINTGRRK